MYYPDELIEEIRTKNDIVDVISSYVKLQKKGGSHMGLCPFHNEKSPSFSVSGYKQIFHCFGCGEGGNVISFIMKYENYSFQEAIQMLAERAGVSLPEISYSEEAKSKERARARYLEMNKEAATYFYYQLKSEKGTQALEYLNGRKLLPETIKNFGLGFSNKTSNDLSLYLKSKGYSDKELITIGLSSFDERFGLHDKFWNRVMFPIQDVNNKVIGFGGRVMGDGNPKYLNSAETPVFDKSRNLYGLNFARASRTGNIIVCEGYLDVIAMHQAGFKQAVASLGTAFTSGQANLLRRYTDEVILAYDSDNAGIKAAIRAIGILKEAGLSAKILNVEPYKDPDEFINELGKEALQQRIQEAENSFFFEVRILKASYNLQDPEDKTKFHKEIARKLCSFEIDIERDNYTQAIAEKYLIGIENLKKLVQSYAAQNGDVKQAERPKSGIQKKMTAYDHKKKVQRMLITWITDEPDIYHKIKKYIGVGDFTEDLYKEVATMLFDHIEHNKYNPASIISKFEDEEVQKEVSALFHTKLDGIDSIQEKEKALHDIVYAVKKCSYEYYTEKSGSDVRALQEVIAGKKALEELAKVHILLS